MKRQKIRYPTTLAVVGAYARGIIAAEYSAFELAASFLEVWHFLKDDDYAIYTRAEWELGYQGKAPIERPKLAKFSIISDPCTANATCQCLRFFGIDCYAGTYAVYGRTVLSERELFIVARTILASIEPYQVRITSRYE